MVQYARPRRRGMGGVGWLLTAAGILVAPILTIFLINAMFGVSVPYTMANYLLTFAIYIVVLFVVGAASILGRRVG